MTEPTPTQPTPPVTVPSESHLNVQGSALNQAMDAALKSGDTERAQLIQQAMADNANARAEAGLTDFPPMPESQPAPPEADTSPLPEAAEGTSQDVPPQS